MSRLRSVCRRAPPLVGTPPCCPFVTKAVWFERREQPRTKVPGAGRDVPAEGRLRGGGQQARAGEAPGRESHSPSRSATRLRRLGPQLPGASAGGLFLALPGGRRPPPASPWARGAPGPPPQGGVCTHTIRSTIRFPTWFGSNT